MDNVLNYVMFSDRIELIFSDELYTIKAEDRALFTEIGKVLASSSDKKYSDVKKILQNSPLKKMCDELVCSNYFKIANNKVYIDDVEITETIGKLIINCVNDGIDSTPLVNFIKKIRQNPNKKIINDITDFIYKSYIDGGFSISEDGNIIAYKKVRGTYKDIHSNTYLNLPGSYVSMDRNLVCSNRNETCAPGLHFCSYSYLESFASNSSDDRILIIEINPMDIISVPYDYNFAKGRCCAYRVVGEINYKDKLTKPIVDTKTESTIKNKLNTFEEKVLFAIDLYDKNMYNSTDEYFRYISNLFTLNELDAICDFILLAEDIMTTKNNEFKSKKCSKIKFIEQFRDKMFKEFGVVCNPEYFNDTLKNMDTLKNALDDEIDDDLDEDEIIEQLMYDFTYDELFYFIVDKFNLHDKVSKRHESKAKLIERFVDAGISVNKIFNSCYK